MKKEDSQQTNPIMEAIGTRDLGDAVDEARELVDFTTQQVQDAREALDSVQSPLLRIIGVLLLSAGVLTTLTTALDAFDDWYLYPAFYLVTVVFSLLYTKAMAQRRFFSGTVFLIAICGLLGFFSWSLTEAMAPQSIWFRSEVVFREGPRMLWISVGLHSLVALGLGAHWIFGFAKRRRESRIGNKG